jgi:hypothetical protein
MSDEERKAYQSGLAGTGPPASGGSAWDAYIRGDAIRRETERRLRESTLGSGGGGFSPSGFSSAQSPTGFSPSTGYSTPTGYGASAGYGGSAAGGGPLVSGTASRVLGWISVLTILGLIAVAQGPRLGENLYLLFVLLVPLWVGLYPINGLATAGTYLWLDRMLPLAGSAAVVGAAVVFVLTHRLEHSLAQGARYRMGRHVFRLVLFGVAGYAQLLRYEGGVLVAPVAFHVWRFMQNPLRTLAVVLGTIVTVHVLVWSDNPIRARWHDILDALRLRPKGA